jgi:hypothetical protein
MLSEPTDRLLVANVAVPPLGVAVPSVVEPFEKVTVFVSAAVTVAVNVTELP